MDNYLFVLRNEKALCLICSKTVSVLKEYNLKRHYSTKNSQYDSLVGRPREEKAEKLRKALIGQQIFFTKKQNQCDNIVRASYIVSEKVAKYSKNYSDGKFMKGCIKAVSEIIYSDKKKTLKLSVCLAEM